MLADFITKYEKAEQMNYGSIPFESPYLGPISICLLQIIAIFLSLNDPNFKSTYLLVQNLNRIAL